MERTDVWESLLQAEANVDYFSIQYKLTNAFNAFVKVLLLCSSVGGVVAMVAKDEWQRPLTVVSGVAGLVAILGLPVFDPAQLAQRVLEIRDDWIDIKNIYQRAWIQPESGGSDSQIEPARKLQIKIEKRKGYVPNWQWLFDRCYRLNCKRRGTSVTW